MKIIICLIVALSANISFLGIVYAKGCKPELRASGAKSSRQGKAERNAISAWENVSRKKYGRGGTYEWINAGRKSINCSGRARKQCVAAGKPCPTIRKGANKNAENPRRLRCKGSARLVIDNEIETGKDYCTAKALRIVPPKPSSGYTYRNYGALQTADCPRNHKQHVIRGGRDVCVR